jgi:hypothetical protein
VGPSPDSLVELAGKEPGPYQPSAGLLASSWRYPAWGRRDKVSPRCR